METPQIYDPASPSSHGYPLLRYDPSFPLLRYDPPFSTFFKHKLFKWWSECLWSIYGRDEVVAFYLHREQTLFGTLENWMAKQILLYIYGE